ncbi:parallel beta helix pectate lyase-like protein [Jejuia pallidilutea]|uniref:Parallel beta helix pectate lyase-like protein n=2 Tax=Jejuia pallidilutea TaxID=504487 RepID=A0A362X031_9FLAO|nr:parallel beta helix pectate lyase-like protein [Jejuia pallidilutea]
MSLYYKTIILFAVFLFCTNMFAKDYFVHPKTGSDTNTGISKKHAFKSLQRASKVNLKPGDRLLLAHGETYTNGLVIVGKKGTAQKPIVITSIVWNSNKSLSPAIINFKGLPNGVLIEDSSFLELSNIQLTANGYSEDSKQNSKMRCGILVRNNNLDAMGHLVIKNITIYNIYYENTGFNRGKDEVRTANGTQKYGWGIRVMNNKTTIIDDVKIMNCSISNVSHTGIKLTGINKNISNIKILDNVVKHTGGPGIQMSGVTSVYVANNTISHSGNADDTRKWGRGSGLWTWGSSHVLIEKNEFLYANGPGDSAGAHIDFNCDNIVLQYNISAYNAGGFCEILGNNYNCAYRYNISINDGYRIKGKNGAFQEGKILWLSGYQGGNKERKGPVNSYIYNNTIYSDSTIVSKIAIDNTSNGILIANNIFYLEGDSKAVLGDQYKPDKVSGDLAKNVFFKNNLFLNTKSWPAGVGIVDEAPIFGNPDFVNKGGIKAEDYIPKNVSLIKNKGILVKLLESDANGLIQSLELKPKKDIIGNVIKNIPSLGAIEPK